MFDVVRDLLSASFFETWTGVGAFLLFLFGSLGTGLFLLPPSIARPSTRALAGVPLFFMLGGAGAFLVYLLAGSTGATITFFILSVAALGGALVRHTFQPLFRPNECLLLAFLLVVGVVVMFFGWGETSDGTIRATSGAWADGPLHVLNAEAFRQRTNGSLAMPAFAGELFREPIGMDFLAGLLRRSGFTLGGAFTLPAGMLLASLLAAIASLTEFLLFRVREQHIRAFVLYPLVTLLLLLGGGAQWLIMVVRTGAWTPGTFFGVHTPTWDKAEDLGLIWANHINIFSSQKHFLLASAFLLLLALVLLLRGREQKTSDSLLIVMAVATAVVPFFHAHAFIAALGVWILAAILFRHPSVFLGLAISGIGALPFFAWYMGAVTRDGFITFAPGYLAPSSLFGWFGFWFVNLGVFPLLAALSLRHSALRKDRLLLAVPALSLFFLGNLIQFQPYLWDNHKIFLFAWFLFSPLIAMELILLWKSTMVWRRVIASFLFIFLVLTTVSETTTYTHFRKSYPVYTSADRARGAALAASLPSSAVVLAATDDVHRHPVTLTGRNLVMAYGGWIWTRGMDFHGRAAAITSILRSVSKEELCGKLIIHRVTHIIVGPEEQFTWAERSSTYVQSLLGLRADNALQARVLSAAELCR